MRYYLTCTPMSVVTICPDIGVSCDSSGVICYISIYIIKWQLSADLLQVCVYASICVHMHIPMFKYGHVYMTVVYIILSGFPRKFTNKIPWYERIFSWIFSGVSEAKIVNSFLFICSWHVLSLLQMENTTIKNTITNMGLVT